MDPSCYCYVSCLLVFFIFFYLSLFIIGFPRELSSAPVFSMFVCMYLLGCVCVCVCLYVFVLYLFVSVMENYCVYVGGSFCF